MFCIVQSCPAFSRSVGLVVIPWNIPRGISVDHSDSMAVSRKRRFDPRWF